MSFQEEIDLSVYSLVDGTRPFSGAVGGILPVNGSDLATKEYVDSNVSFVSEYYYNDDASDIGGIYYDMTDTPTGEGESTFTSGSLGVGDDQALFNFATEANIPGITNLEKGIYTGHVHAQKTAGTKPVKLHFEIYSRTVGGVETLICTSEESDFITAKGDVEVHAVLINDVSIATTDRVITKWLANVDATGSDVTIALYAEGTTSSHTEVPTSTETLNQVYVRQDGTKPLLANWDAGSFKITAETFESDIATGTAPLVVASTTMVSNLNADLLDGNHAAAFSVAAHLHDGQTLQNDGIDSDGAIGSWPFDTTVPVEFNQSVIIQAGAYISNTSNLTQIQLESDEVIISGSALSVPDDAIEAAGITISGPSNFIDTVAIDGEARYIMDLTDLTSYAQGDGAGIAFGGKYTSGGLSDRFGAIWVQKESAVDGNNAGEIHLGTMVNGGTISTGMYIDSTLNIHTIDDKQIVFGTTGSYMGDTDNVLHINGDGSIQLKSSGTTRLTIADAVITSTVDVVLPDGGSIRTASGPEITLDSSNGFIEMMGGNVGIGTTTPSVKTHIFVDDDTTTLTPPVSHLLVENDSTTTGSYAALRLRSNTLDNHIVSINDGGVNSGRLAFFVDETSGSNIIEALAILSNSGNVGIGTASPDASALLDISSTTKGALFPRMTFAQMQAISTPPQGLTVFVTDNFVNALFTYNSHWSKWTSPEYAIVINNDGGAISQGDVVTPNAGGPDFAVQTSTGSGNSEVCGVVCIGGADDTEVLIKVSGEVDVNKISGTITIDEYLFNSTTAGSADYSNTAQSGVFAIAIETTSGSQVRAIMTSVGNN